MRIVGPIQFWRGCLIYQKEERKYIYIYIFKENLKKISSKICGTIFFQNLWNYLPPKLWNSFPPKTLIQIASKIFEKNFLKNHWKYFPPKSLKQISSKIFEEMSSKMFEKIFLQNLWCIHQFPDAKKLHRKGTDTYTGRHHGYMKESARGRFFEKLVKSKCHKLETKMKTRFKS